MSDLRPRRAMRMPPTIARHGRLRASNPFATVLKFLAAIVAVALVSAGSVFCLCVGQCRERLQAGRVPGRRKRWPARRGLGAFDGGINLLLVGSDSGEGDAQYGKRGENLNDVTILLHVSAGSQQRDGGQLPARHVRAHPVLPAPDGKGNYSPMSSQKINTTLSYGGLACTVLTVSQLTGLDIPFAGEDHSSTA